MWSSSNNSSYSNPPCAACKFLRRKCLPDGCIFAPCFPPEEPTKFVNVHRIFGASNVGKLLNEIPPHQREDAVNSLAYEAEARLRDPVYGCVGAISVLQRQVAGLQKELDATNAELLRFANNHSQTQPMTTTETSTSSANYGSGYFDPISGILLPYSNWGSWNNDDNNNNNNNNNNNTGSSGERPDDQVG